MVQKQSAFVRPSLSSRVSGRPSHVNLFLLSLSFSLPASQAEAIEYRYAAVVERVIDGDSVVVDVPEWPAPFRPINVRVAGVNTPETKKRKGRCEIERKLGAQVAAWVRERLPKGSKVTLIWQGQREKYGRPLVRVLLPTGQDMSEALIKAGYAVEYQGGQKLGWCKWGR